MIEVKNLTFRYSEHDRPAVDDVAFATKAGEIFGFLGPSGAGKSTTQKIAIGLLNGYSGTVEVFGKELGSWGKGYYERIGVSFELPNHFQKLSALENLEFFGSLYSKTEDPMLLLEKVGLAEDANKKVGSFSKGMQMRLNFARALLNKPSLLFLDEPTSGMDPINARKIKDSILEQKELGNTIFLTTHNMDLADELCDRLAFIVDGKVELTDSPEQLKVAHGERIVTVAYMDRGQSLKEDFPVDGLGDNAAFLRLLKTAEVQSIHTKEPTLEDIFIHVTGRSLQ